MAEQIYNHFKEFISWKESNESMKMGLNHIDGVVNDIGKGKVVVVAGRSIDGRDVMLNTLIKNLAIDQKKPSLILNLATSEDTFYSNIISIVDNTSIDDLMSEDIATVENASKGSILENMEIYVDFPKDRSLENIDKTIREYTEKGVELVFIDLYQAIGNTMDLFDEDELVYFKENNSKLLYLLAKDLKINIFIGTAISYLADEREGGPDEQMPQLKDLTYAGRLDEFSDLAIGVYVPYVHRIFYEWDGKCFRDVIKVSILKNRINLKMGRFSMIYDIDHNRVVDDKEYNKLALEELKKKNDAFNELVINLGLEQKEEI